MIAQLPVLIVNPHSRCNCRCVMCDIWKRDTVDEISPELFDRQLASIEKLGVEWVVFSGGEALMHSDLFGLCARLRQRKVHVTLLSSGLLLGRFAERIVEHVDDLIVSLDGPPHIHNAIRRVANAFELLAGGVDRIRSVAGRYPVAARCTVQRENCAHLMDTVKTAREAGLDSISFLAADTHSEAFNRKAALPMLLPDGIALTAADLPVLNEQIERLIVSGECGGFVIEGPEKLRRIARCFHTPTAPVCNAPWTSAVVEADGAVRPCFFHPPVGHLTAHNDLAEVLNGPAASAFRSSLDIARNEICRRCVCSLNWKGAAA